MDPDTHPAAFIAETVECPGCAARERKSRADHKDGKQPPPGTKYRVRNRAKG